MACATSLTFTFATCCAKPVANVVTGDVICCGTEVNLTLPQARPRRPNRGSLLPNTGVLRVKSKKYFCVPLAALAPACSNPTIAREYSPKGLTSNSTFTCFSISLLLTTNGSFVMYPFLVTDIVYSPALQ